MAHLDMGPAGPGSMTRIGDSDRCHIETGASRCRAPGPAMIDYLLKMKKILPVYNKLLFLYVYCYCLLIPNNKLLRPKKSTAAGGHRRIGGG